MPVAAPAIRVENFRELSRAFSIAEHEMKKRFRASLRDAAEPIREEAERLAGSGAIANLKTGDPWTRMRTGVTRTSVYVAPRERGRRTRGNPTIGRPNLKPLLLDRSLEPALDKHRDDVLRNFEGVLGDVARLWDRAA